MSREALTAIRADALAAKAKLDTLLARIDAELANAPSEQASPPSIDPQLIADLKRDEGLRLNAYPDPLSGGPPWTIGYGHTGPEVRKGLTWTQAEAEAALLADIEAHNAQLAAALPWVAGLDPARRRVLQNMCFNLGIGVPGGTKGLLGFKNTLGMIERGDYASAADAMEKSLWARQVKGRAKRLAEQMRKGGP